MKKIFALLLVGFVATSYAQPATVVNIESGKISGKTTDDGTILSYKGIPFAEPPVGDLRWRAPRPVKAWQGIKECTRFSASPMQSPPVPFSMWSEEFLIPKEPIGEDCLYLNVWTAAKSDNKKRPVLVWIYGGGFRSGGSACPIYDGEAMARKGVIFVSINYRVGIFGFFAHPGLASDGEKSGNFGLLDQIAALQWVKRNIASFGGDPEQVTIAGQSAGSMSVNALVASPLAKGLFNKAIGQSGANFTRGNPEKSVAEMEIGRSFQSLGASSLLELRKISSEELFKKGSGNYRPYIDGHVLPAHIADIYAQGKQNKVALLTGWNQDEGLMITPMKNAVDYKADMAKRFGEKAAALLSVYPGDSDATASQSQLDLSRDQVFGLHNYIWGLMQDKQKLSAYVYRFTRIVPATGEYKKFKAFHTGEVPYAYNNLSFVNRPWEEADHQLANMMSDYWVNFIKTGNPNGKGLPNWPLFNEKERQTLYFDVKSFAAPMKDFPQLELLKEAMVASK